MKTSITPFAFGDNMIRVHQDEEGNPWFVAKDVCRVLGIENNRDAIVGLDDDERITVFNPDGNPRAGIPHQYALVSESGLYALVFRSRKPEAKAFSKWVRAEVLPSIRRVGSYAVRNHQQAGHSSLPDALPPEALDLRPTMRQRLWQDALQTARLDGGGSDTALEWFTFLCRMMAAAPPAPTPARDKVQAFFHQCCQYGEGSSVRVADLYESFRRWHRDKQGDLPSKKTFGVHLQEFAQRSRSNGSIYRNIILK